MDIAASFIVGTGLGILNYTSLWFTIKHVSSVKKPSLFIMASYFLRMAITAAGFFLVMDGRWENLIACLAGFLTVRFVFVKLFQPKKGLGELPGGG